MPSHLPIRVVASFVLGAFFLFAGCVSDAPSQTPSNDAGTSAPDSSSDASNCESCTPRCLDRLTSIVCEEGPDSCLEAVEIDCPAGTTCDASLGTCVNSCQTCEVGQTRCSNDGSEQEICVEQEGGCSRFVGEPCADGVCIENGSDASCVQHECTPGGDGQCMGADYYGCESDDQTGQWVLVFEETCGPLQTCSGGAGCECINPCVESMPVCDQGVLYSCREDPATGCTQLVDDAACKDAVVDELVACVDATTALVCVTSADGCLVTAAKGCAACTTGINGTVSCT